MVPEVNEWGSVVAREGSGPEGRLHGGEGRAGALLRFAARGNALPHPNQPAYTRAKSVRAAAARQRVSAGRRDSEGS